jgi:drug/metabolite transporter (DMT)-like permease
MGCLAAGLLMVFAGEQPIAATAPNPLLGNAVAAGSGVSWALTIIGLRWAGKSPLPNLVPAALVFGNLLAFAVALPGALPVAGASTVDWAIIAYLGACQVGLGYLFLSAGVRHVGALEVSLILLLEPALNPVWAWLIHGEAPGAWPLAGGAAILIATTVRTALDARRS